jgi:hypothetical protein
MAEALDIPDALFVNPHGETIDEQSVHTVLMRRQNAFDCWGLDESAYYGGVYSGPWELVRRARVLQWPLRDLPGTGGAAVSHEYDHSVMTMTGLLEEVWPAKFEPDRSTPLRVSPALKLMVLGTSAGSADEKLDES